MSVFGDLRKAGIESDGTSIQLIESGSQLNANGNVLFNVVTLDSTLTGHTTLTTAQLLRTFLCLDPGGANRNLTTPTASEIIASIKSAKTNNSFFLIIRNTADADETLTLVGGTGVTLKTGNTNTITQNNTKIFLVRVTGATTVGIASIGTLVH